MRSAIVSIANSMSSDDSSDSASLKQPDSKSTDIKVIMTTDNANTMHKFFDTRVKEKHWVLPNVYCNEHRVLAAVAWMISPRSLSDNNNKGMHARFKDVIPPPFDPNKNRGYKNKKSLEDPHRNGVYCNWEGWLYDSADGHFHHYFKTSNGDALFTFIDVYCHRYTDEDGNAQHTVRYFAKAEVPPFI